MEQPTVKNNVFTDTNHVVDGLVENFVEEVVQSDQLPSYQLTRWQFINTILARIDVLSQGRAGVIQRFTSFFLIGGSTSVLNLVILYTVLHYIPLPVAFPVHNFIASALGCEISLLANFLLNDYFTFRHLAGHRRSWGERLARFHTTALVGIGLTILIQTGLTNVFKVLPIVGQAIAIILVMFYNFTFHHFFTYRHLRTRKAMK